MCSQLLLGLTAEASHAKIIIDNLIIVNHNIYTALFRDKACVRSKKDLVCLKREIR